MVAEKKKTIIGLIIAVSILAALLIGLSIAYGVTASTMSTYTRNLESVYNKNFYDLVDNINNTEVKLSKLIASNNDSYSQKLLLEVSQNAANAENNISSLPLSINGLSNSIKFINQLSGYTTTLSNKVVNGGSLTSEDRAKLVELHDSVVNMKIALNNMCKDLNSGYSILDNSLTIQGDFNDFTSDMSGMQGDVEYPSMIYDGPFSDSQIYKDVKGLNYEEVTKEVAETNLRQIFANTTSVEYTGESQGTFNCYNFKVKTSNNMILYVEMTKKGGRLLTCSGSGDKDGKNITLENAISIGKTFLSKAGINDVESVWSDVVGGDAYINFAPIVENTILYPDLVKIKVDLNEGVIAGYEASSYYFNHIERNLSSASVGATEARAKVNSNFAVQTQKLALIPIDYGKEVLTYEFKCVYEGATYYIYINALNGNEENILKVIETEDGNKLL